MLQIRCFVVSLLLLNIFFKQELFAQKNDFRGKVTYRYTFTESKFDESFKSLGILNDSLITYHIAGDSLLAIKTLPDGQISKMHVRLNGESFIYNPYSYLKTDYKKLPSVNHYKFVRKHKRKETILGYHCTKYEYALGADTQIFFWVADDISLTNHGTFFNFISKEDKLVLKRQLIWKNEGNTYEAIKIDSNLSTDDFDYLNTF